MMENKIHELIKQLSSPDINKQKQALALLIKQGWSASEALCALLDNNDIGLRVYAMQGLAEIGNPDNAEVFRRALKDNDERIRARAAQGLTRINNGQAVEALVQTINDFPDVLHYPYTLSVHALIQLGKPALPALVPLLTSSEQITRERAFLIIRTIVSQLPDIKDWNQLWEMLGSYDVNENPEHRKQAADLWAQWIKHYVSM